MREIPARGNMKYCKWTYNDLDDYYDIQCYFGGGYTFVEGGVKENHFVFCPYCGKKIKEKKK